jgi:hypothetical protein
LMGFLLVVWRGMGVVNSIRGMGDVEEDVDSEFGEDEQWETLERLCQLH